MALLLGPLRRVTGGRSRPRTPTPRSDDTGRSCAGPRCAGWPALTFVGVFVGYGQFEAGFPGFGRQVAEVSTRAIGLAYAVNSAVIVLLQFVVLSRITGRRRTRVMVVMAVVWALAWLLLGAAGLVPGTAAAAVGTLAFMGVFAFGETLMQPTIPAIGNDLAADHTRGRSTR